MKWKIEYTASVNKTVKKLDKLTQQRLKNFIENKVAKYPNPRQIGKPLKGQTRWRYRMGNYRILANINDETITILIVAVGHRKQIYK